MMRSGSINIRKLLLFLSCMAIMLIACSCGFLEDETESPGGPNIESQGDINDRNISDLDSLYSNDFGSVQVLYLTVSEGNSGENTDHTWADVNANTVFYYDELGIDRYKCEAILQIGDESGPLPGQLGYDVLTPNATVNIRGATSSRANQKSYTIKLKNNKGTWNGQKTILLNKHPYDELRFKNKLSYDLMRSVPGMMSLRTQFVRLYVKDLTASGASDHFVDYGLFTQVEQVNKTYLRNHGLDPNGQLYKANFFEFYRYEDAILPTDSENYDENLFHTYLESKGNSDHTKLIAMLEDLNNYAIPIEETFEKYFNSENYFTWLAFQMLTGNDDTSSQNFYLYSPYQSHTWYFISWDNDGAWSLGESALRGEDLTYNYMRGVTNYWGSILHQRVLKVEKYRNMLDAKIEEIRGILTNERIQSLTDLYQTAVKEYVFRMPDNQNYEYSEGQLNEMIAKTREEVEYNYQMYKESISRPMPFYLDIPTAIAGTTLSFVWNSSYDFGNEKLTYTFELSSDCNFTNVILKKDQLSLQQVTTDMLPAGQYFFRVTATNESGRTQTAMERYDDINDIRHYGVRCFYIGADGAVRSDAE